VPRSILNCSIKVRSWDDICARSSAAFCDSRALLAVPPTASATPAMFAVISSDPFAASVTLRAISRVAPLYSSTAVAMVAEMSLTCMMAPVMEPIPSTAPCVLPGWW